ncbi:A-factor-processing enzyme [Nakaseomyces glabratus]|nr:A-factor-processing enzyme [Nakaseomyces glabratus]KTB20658.1 A-factor-processing enzyme [Nakaseomyces glabratus]
MLVAQSTLYRSVLPSGVRIALQFKKLTSYYYKKNYTTVANKSTMPYKDLKVQFLKPDLDDRQYRYIQLPNNLKALIIQDATTDKAAAALDVNIGAFQDPENLPGLAHFCEHLLFMGSEKFPDENEYSSYLSKHGGSSNAYTGSQNTNYFFEVNADHLHGALDRFSGFFSCPLFNQNSTDKEINAVDSENKKNLQNDIWRMYQLDKSLSNQDHPYHKFSTGNLETLGDKPKAAGLDIREELLKFYNENYSANLMKLCILGKEDLDTLSEWAWELFKDVKNSDRALPVYDAPILKENDLKKIIKVKPVKDLRKLDISFVVPDYEKKWEAKISHIFSHLIGHEGSGSLLAHLKSLGWANELGAGGHTVSDGNAFFNVDIELTNEGLKHYKDIVVLIFQYLEMLKTSLPQEWIFKELQDISNATFKFKQKGSASQTVSGLAKQLEKDYYFPVENILATNLLFKYEPELIKNFMKSFTPENSRITFISRSIVADSKEQWYGTEYSVEDYSPEFLKSIENPGLNPNLSVPRPNEFIATNFDVEKFDVKEPLNEPLLLKDDDVSKLWYKKDDRFWQPRGYIYVTLKLPNTHSSIISSMLTTLYVQMVNDALKDLQYDAACANINLSFVKTNQGLDITISGFNEKLLILLKRFVEGVQGFEPKKERFEVFKDKTVHHLKNQMMEVPYSQISGLYNSVVNERTWPTKEKLEVAEKLKFEQLDNFVRAIYDGMYYESFVHGNLESKEAREVDSLVSTFLKKDDIKNIDVQSNRLRSYIIPKGKSYAYENDLYDENNVNSCIQHVVQLDVYNEKLSALSGLFAQMLHEPCFDILRTKEQLGYVVFSSSLNNHGTANIRILVQSEHTTPYLEWRIDEFYKTFGEKLRNMDEEDFNKHKEALCKTLLQKFKNMKEESLRYVAAIYLGDYNYLHRQKKADMVKDLTKEDMIAFFENYIESDDATKLVIHLKSKKATEKDESQLDTTKYPSGEKIEDVGQFRSQLYLAPLRQPTKKFEIHEEL